MASTLASKVTLPTLRRALLYVPSNTKTLTKSLAFGFHVDNVTYDLEDSIPSTQKAPARAHLAAHLTALSHPDGKQQPPRLGEIAVRINAFSTGLAVDDLRAVAAQPSVDAIVVPKVNSAEDLSVIDEIIRDVAPDRAKPLKLLALIESARAVMDLREICQATPSLAGLIFAAEDFAADTGVRRTRSLNEMAYARSAVVTAARAFRLESAIDLVCVDLSLECGAMRLRPETSKARAFGFDGKQCIHPKQVPAVQAIFSPSNWDIVNAMRVVRGAELAAATGHGAWKLDGKMIDAPVVLKAQLLLEKAKQCRLNVDAIMEDVTRNLMRQGSETKGISIPLPEEDPEDDE